MIRNMLLLILILATNPVSAYNRYNYNSGTYDFNSRVDVNPLSSTSTQVKVRGFDSPLGMEGTVKNNSGLIYDYGAGSLKYVDVNNSEVKVYD